jgi:hypothetical protein
MDFRRSGQLDERRRRVLMDEIASPAADADAAATAGGTAKGPVRAYGAAVLAERQPRVTDLVPVRPLWVVVCLLLLVAGVIAVEAIHIQAVTARSAHGLAQLSALDARQRGSLAAWYSSALLAGAAVGAGVIFSIRAHRVDDYRGRYRVWLWTAAALAWLSLDAATGIHDALGLAMTFVTGRQIESAELASACTIGWIAVYGLVLGTLAVRLMIEVRSSLLSGAAFVIAALLYSYSAVLKLNMTAAPALLAAGVVEAGVLLLAHTSLLVSIGLFARHVYLDATGRLKVHIDPDRKTKGRGRAKLKVVKSDKANDQAKSGQAAQAAKSGGDTAAAKFGSAAASSSSAKPAAAISKATVSSPDPDDEEEEDDEQYAHLSKSERRRLKKLARREQRRAA